MKARPATKAARKSRFGRCPKCQRQFRKHQKRCGVCHRVLKV